MLARPPLWLACKRRFLVPEPKVSVTECVVQLVHEPVLGKLRVDTFEPLTLNTPLRSLDAPLA